MQKKVKEKTETQSELKAEAKPSLLDLEVSGPSHLHGSQKIDFESLVLPQDFALDEPVEQHLSQIRIGRPNAQAFVRFHPKFAKTLYVIAIAEPRETYLIADKRLLSYPVVAKEVKAKVFYLYTNRDRSYGLWEVSSANISSRGQNWGQSAAAVVQIGREKWVRVITAQNVGYRAESAPGISEEPQWPELSDNEILELAFAGRLITDVDHPVLRTLGGQE